MEMDRSVTCKVTEKVTEREKVTDKVTDRVTDCLDETLIFYVEIVFLKKRSISKEVT